MKTVEPDLFISATIVEVGRGANSKCGNPALIERLPNGGYFEMLIARFASSVPFQTVSVSNLVKDHLKRAIVREKVTGLT